MCHGILERCCPYLYTLVSDSHLVCQYERVVTRVSIYLPTDSSVL